MSKNLERRPDDAVASFLDAVRRSPPPQGGRRGRLIFALDATASREPSWDRAMQVQSQMFLEADRLGGLDVQLVFYRGIAECKASRWVGDARSLVDVMTGVTCRAGQTQIARVLRHAGKIAADERLGALVFIGDAVEEGLDGLAGLAGELGLRGVRAFMFQEGYDPRVEAAFREIARLTRGAWARFDASAPGELRELLGAVAVYAAGGLAALEDAARRGSAGVRLLAGTVR